MPTLREIIQELAPGETLDDGATAWDTPNLLDALSPRELDAPHNRTGDAIRRVGPNGYLVDPPAYRIQSTREPPTPGAIRAPGCLRPPPLSPDRGTLRLPRNPSRRDDPGVVYAPPGREAVVEVPADVAVRAGDELCVSTDHARTRTTLSCIHFHVAAVGAPFAREESVYNNDEDRAESGQVQVGTRTVLLRTLRGVVRLYADDACAQDIRRLAANVGPPSEA